MKASNQAARHPVSLYLLKIAEFCNLDCPYCYMFNLKDQSYKRKPKTMPIEVVEAAVPKIARLAREQNVTQVGVSLHGGEPLLVGRSWLREAVRRFRLVESDDLRFGFSVQTNGVLIDEEWLDVLSELKIQVGLSMDGPRELHDKNRFDFARRGSYDRVVRGLHLLQGRPELNPCVLCVIDPEADGLANYKHFRDLGVTEIDFLWPLDYNWDSPPPHLASGKGTPFADYLIPIFDYWWSEERDVVGIRYFKNILTNLAGARGGLDSLGANPVSIVSIDSDGGLEPLDSLKACGDGFTELHLNVMRDDISSMYGAELFQTAIAGQELLSAHCRQCLFQDVCGGGYLPHRYSSESGFRNPSVYCRDLWRLINHLLEASAAAIHQAERQPQVAELSEAAPSLRESA